jgi:ABC-type uncharacterized transport system ATPase subunit
MSTVIEVQGLRKAYGSNLAVDDVSFQVAAGEIFELLPTALLNAGDATPLKHVVLLLQDAWLGTGWNDLQMLIVGGFLAVFALLTVVFVRQAEAKIGI